MYKIGGVIFFSTFAVCLTPPNNSIPKQKTSIPKQKHQFQKQKHTTFLSKCSFSNINIYNNQVI